MIERKVSRDILFLYPIITFLIRLTLYDTQSVEKLMQFHRGLVSLRNSTITLHAAAVIIPNAEFHVFFTIDNLFATMHVCKVYDY